MSRKHFQYAAEYVVSIIDRVEANTVCQAYITLFVKLNPRFDVMRFRKACNL